MGTTLHSLDLFSGIGGLTHALTGLVKPIAYSEIEPSALAVKNGRINSHCLPRAAVSTDVRTLTAAWLRDNAKGKHKKPDTIVAGFPCIGFSLVGKREGYEKAESGLFDEILRRTDELQIKYPFLENVP